MNYESTALVPVKVTPSVALLPSQHDMQVIDQAARMVLAGAITLPPELNSREKVAAVMLYGLELGLKPMTAIRHLYIVKGRVSPSAEVMAGMLMASEPDAQLIVEELTEEKCTMRIKRPSKGINQAYTVTWDEIKKAGLATGNNAAYPRDRLRYHCTKRLLRIYAPEVINNIDGIMLPGGAGPEVVEGEVTSNDLYNEGDEAETPAYREVAPEPTPHVDPDEITVAYMDLVRDKGAQAGKAVMDWAEGMFPHALGAKGKLDKSQLTTDEAGELLSEIKRFNRTGRARCPNEDHEPQFDEDIALMSCSVCGLSLEQPEPVAVQAAAF